MKANAHIVIKREDIFKYLTDNQIKYLDVILNTIADGRKKDDKKPDNSYYICNMEELCSDEVLETILKAESEVKTMTREEKDKLLELMGKERNSYSEHINKEVARLYGKIEGADYILNRLLDYFHNDSEEKE